MRIFLATLIHVDMKSPIIAEQKALEAIISKKLGTSLKNFLNILKIYTKQIRSCCVLCNILSIYHYDQGKFELNLEERNISDIIK